MVTPETRQMGSANSPELLSCKQDYYAKPPEPTAVLRDSHSAWGWVFPLEEYQGIEWDLGDDADLDFFLSPSIQSEGDWSVHAMTQHLEKPWSHSSDMGFGWQNLPRNKGVEFKQILYNTSTVNDQNISPFSQVHNGAMIISPDNVYKSTPSQLVNDHEPNSH